MSIGDVVKFSIVGSCTTGEQTVTTFHFAQYSGTDTIDGSNVAAACSVFTAAWDETYRALITSGWTWQYLQFTGITPTFDGLSYVDTTTTGAIGTASGTENTFERCTIIRRISPTGGRRGRGRMFVPMPPVEWFANDGTLVTPVDDAVTEAIALVPVGLNLIAANLFKPVLFSRDNGTIHYIEGSAVGPIVGVQRRRRTRGGD